MFLVLLVLVLVLVLVLCLVVGGTAGDRREGEPTLGRTQRRRLGAGLLLRVEASSKVAVRLVGRVLVVEQLDEARRAQVLGDLDADLLGVVAAQLVDERVKVQQERQMHAAIGVDREHERADDDVANLLAVLVGVIEQRTEARGKGRQVAGAIASSELLVQLGTAAFAVTGVAILNVVLGLRLLVVLVIFVVIFVIIIVISLGSTTTSRLLLRGSTLGSLSLLGGLLLATSCACFHRILVLVVAIVLVAISVIISSSCTTVLLQQRQREELGLERLENAVLNVGLLCREHEA